MAIAPYDSGERNLMRRCIRQYAEAHSLVPPLSMEELTHHARAVIAADTMDERYADFVTVLLGNEVWRDTVAAVPYERRVLLLPQCLRSKSDCPADSDEFGLLCEECGQCPIGAIQSEAEELGYVVLIAEGTTVVTRLLEQGTVDAVIGASCLTALERSFPYMANDAIPGIAVPLIRDGCDQTEADLEWIMEAVRLKSDGRWSGRLDIEALRREIDAWFDAAQLHALLGGDGTRTEGIAESWLLRSGKRWRPLLAVCAYQSLTDTRADVPETMKKIALAVECFHKASLVHDDIEDDDALRYGEQTLHREYGVPLALNVGDLLLGEGYCLIGSCGATSEQTAGMLRIAAEGHRNLCLGQGAELCWMRDPGVLSSQSVLEIFRRKTAPAFEVALRLGATYAGAGEEIGRVLTAFSEALGIGYQIRDDIEDFEATEGDNDVLARRPSLLFALALEHAAAAERDGIVVALRQARAEAGASADGLLAPALVEVVERKARQLLEHYKNVAIRSLNPLENAHLKSLLRRLVGKILS